MNTKIAASILAGTMFTTGALTAVTFTGKTNANNITATVQDFNTAAQEYIELAEEVISGKNTDISKLVEKVNALKQEQANLESSSDKNQATLKAELEKANTAIETANSTFEQLEATVNNELDANFDSNVVTSSGEDGNDKKDIILDNNVDSSVISDALSNNMPNPTE